MSEQERVGRRPDISCVRRQTGSDDASKAVYCMYDVKYPIRISTYMRVLILEPILQSSTYKMSCIQQTSQILPYLLHLPEKQCEITNYPKIRVHFIEALQRKNQKRRKLLHLRSAKIPLLLKSQTSFTVPPLAADGMGFVCQPATEDHVRKPEREQH